MLQQLFARAYVSYCLNEIRNIKMTLRKQMPLGLSLKSPSTGSKSPLLKDKKCPLER